MKTLLSPTVNGYERAPSSPNTSRGGNAGNSTIVLKRPAQTRERPEERRCPHQPPCPPADAIDRDAARIVASVPEQGWCLRCNGVITFDDTGELLPDCRARAPQRGPAPHRQPA
jgi:hypothetical protein